MSAEEKYTYCIDKINSLAGNLLAGMLPNYGEDLVFKIENLVECLENTRLPESLEETFTVSFDFKNRDLRLLYKLSLQVDFVDTKDIPWVEILNIVGFQGDGKQHVDRFRRVIQGDSQEDKKEKKIGDQLYEIADKKSVKTVDFYHSPSNIFLDICYFFNVEDIIKGIDDVYLQKMPISEECKIFIKNLHNDYCTSLKKKRAKHPSQEVVNLERIENIAEKARNAGYYFINELRTLMHPMIFNRNLEFFIYLCRSVLRAENVIQRDFSDLLRNAEKSLQSQNKGIPELIQESFIYRPNEAYLVTEKIAEDFADMLKEYFAFNRKFDSVFEDSEGKIIMDGGRDLSASYMERYEIQRRSLEDFLNVDCIFPTYSMFPHIFKLLLEMTAVDYNFVLDSKRFKTLLDLDALLNGNISKGKDLEKFNNKKESQKIKGIIHMWKDIEK
ncbi:MAG: hypothetical protein FWC10_06440, partial [Lentimicrobiaceae bacterium]|nr:hypothetical protein [Lentimicrobiaceae bacterium]